MLEEIQNLNLKVAQLTSAFNSLVSNSKDIDSLPEQTTFSETSKLHVSNNGISEKLEVSKILSAFDGGLENWEAKVYTNYISVVRDNSIYILNSNVTLPYNSTDFDAELSNDIWVKLYSENPTEVTTFAEITNGRAGLYYLTVEDNTDPNDVKEIGEYIKLSDESIFSTKPNMAQIDTTKPDYVKNKNRVVQVLVSRNLQPSDNDAWLIVTDNVTLTLTSNLQSDFACNIDTEGVTCDINAGTETLYAPSGNQVVADGSGIIYRKPNGEFTFKTN